MKKSRNKGEIDSGIIILAALCIIIFIFILPARKNGSTFNFFSWDGNGRQSSRQADEAYEEDGDLATNSPYTEDIEFNANSGGSETDPEEEYVVIRNESEAAINITGWRLQNARDARVEPKGKVDIRRPSQAAIIPQAALYVSAGTGAPINDIVLRPGDQAVITTGHAPRIGRTRPSSFRENICSAYLEDRWEEDFNTGNSYRGDACGYDKDDLAIASFDEKCRDVISSLSCEMPEIGGRDDDKTCRTCVNGEEVSNACLAFIKSHFTYESCVIQNAYTEEFLLPTVRVFLNLSSELWAEEYETVFLYDREGRLIAYDNY